MRSKEIERIIESQFVDEFSPEHQEGPDFVIPSDKLKTSRVEDTVRLKIKNDGEAPWKPESVVTLFKNVVDQYPNKIALVVKRNEIAVRWTYTDYWNDVNAVAKGFIKLGLQRLHSVAILGYNAPEWFISFLAAIFAGGVGVGIYTTNSSDACRYILENSRANIIVVENEIQLQKILPHRHNLPHLKAIVQYLGEPSDPNVISWKELLLIGNSIPKEVLTKRIKSLAINQCCCLIYTSGTTGDSKGVMLSHDNLTFFVKYVSFKVWKFKMAKDVRVTYLPLSHVAALNGDLFGGIVVAAETHFAPADALKGKLVDFLRESQPHDLVAVPRVWEKMCEKIREVENSATGTKKKLMTWARNQATQFNAKRMNASCGVPLMFSLANALVLSKIKKALGLNRATNLVCGGAALSKDVLSYFLSLNMTITECYGLSETAGPHSIHLEHDFCFGSVGRVLPEFEVKIDKPDEGGKGEILLRGRNVFMGYLNMEDKTDETIEDDGWIHTGDLGYLNRQNFLFITGRLKELLVTSGGENVPPLPIENAVKELLPIISNCMLVGDGRKFLSMVITVKCEMDLDTLMPLDKMSRSAVEWCNSVGSGAKLVSDVAANKDAKVNAAVQKGIDVYNATKAISNAQKIQKWSILSRDFSIPTGEIGPSLKLIRPIVLKNFCEVIDAMYVD